MPTDRPYQAAPDTSHHATTNAETDLANLRQDFPGHRIWRAVRTDGTLGDWVASLHDPAAGVDPTVIQPSAAELREVLEAQSARAPKRRTP
ncbi:hypothetical protein [Actinomadura litoris]|uniref:Uncharacterized protein n=1 Tax=Actinomadura litoris TaxID=2678616 RepID=A0A7K1L8Q1_9ACTN|nr:hypothetical protein [Actinomadura litoris]MUN40817.1 hypothetical protein [Actinomadura litoris]